ncbi:DNA-directed RNA polymerase III subunit RPC6 [Euphorbia peplus]|nr:DNA-directed RNA polymerase III subunit RPC6 [Euphorbia peplus]
MSRSQGLKRKQPDSNSSAQSLTEHEHKLYEVIRSKEGMGIWTRDMKKETNFPDNVVNKSVKTLLAKNLIKEVVNIHYKGKKHYMASEFEPSKEISGGSWYVDGSLDIDFIKCLKEVCKKQILMLKVATLEGVTDNIKKSRAFKTELSKQQIDEIIRALILDNEIIEVKSDGMGEFARIPIDKVCYKCRSRGSTGGDPKIGAMASIPCGVCPRISHCTPDGIISPISCAYYTKWLEF